MLVHTDANSTRQNGDRWHSDVSCDEEPPMGSILHLHTVPPCGGDTLFASMYAAWDALSEPMKALLAPLEARHESAHLYDHLYGDDMVRRRNEWPSAVHPVVRTHPETGRKALFVNSIFTRRILGVTESESRGLLDFLFEHVTNPALPVPVPVAPELDRLLGQPMRPAPRDVGTTFPRPGAEPASRWRGIGRITEAFDRPGRSPMRARVESAAAGGFGETRVTRRRVPGVRRRTGVRGGRR